MGVYAVLQGRNIIQAPFVLNICIPGASKRHANIPKILGRPQTQTVTYSAGNITH
jgi:hypothetical protein